MPVDQPTGSGQSGSAAPAGSAGQPSQNDPADPSDPNPNPNDPDPATTGDSGAPSTPNNPNPPANPTPDAGSSNADCNVSVVAAVPGQGCSIRMVTPNRCEQVDLSNGKSYEFAWTTDGTWCETPFKLYLAGNPVSEANSKVFSYSTNYKNGMITHNGGLDALTAADFEGLTSDNGLYHWMLAGFHGSHPESQAFYVKF
jgi:hypothetical protein